MRKLATVRKIDAIYSIPGADRIEQIIIGGWSLVSQKGLHEVGKHVVYCEPDSVLPVKEEYDFLKNYYINKHGFEGYRLKTIKLRGTISAGVILELGDLPKEEGLDVTEALGIVKYEPPIPAELAGQIKGNFPSFLVKTDEERIANFSHKDLEEIHGKELSITEKLDGTSMTVFKHGEFGVCSRNWRLEESDNTMWKLAREIEHKIPEGICVQGELIGPGIQGNYYNLKEPKFLTFTTYDIVNAKRVSTDLVDIPKVPYLGTITFEFTNKVDTITNLVNMADGRSVISDVNREGLVFRNLEANVSFKSISNKFLMKQKD